jgi:hypothetical protein
MIREAFLLLRLRGQAALVCLLCEHISYHLEDVTQRYCHACNTYLDEVPETYRRPPRQARSNPGWKAWGTVGYQAEAEPAAED